MMTAATEWILVWVLVGQAKLSCDIHVGHIGAKQSDHEYDKKRAYIESQKQAYKSLHPNKQRPNCSSTSQLRANSRQIEHMANSIKNKPVNNTEITYAASLIKTCTNTVTTLPPNSPSRMKIGWNFNLGGIRIAAVPVKSRVSEK
jgi:hypothetical protein